MLPLYYLGLFLCSATSTFATQKYGRNTKSYRDIFVFAIVTGILAMTIFFFLTGCTLEFSLRSILYAAFYALLVLASYFTRLPVYRYMGIAEVGVITSGGSLLFTMLLGILLFNETFTIFTGLKLGLMLGAFWFLFATKRQKNNPTIKHALGPGLSLCAAIIAIGVLSSGFSKTIASDPLVPDANSLFFFTNVFTTLFASLFLFLQCKGNVASVASQFRSITPPQYFTIFVGTAASNVQSLLAVLILASDALSLYAPLSSALGILATEVVAVCIAHEKPKILPVALASTSMLLSFFG